jgi:hypothetical protein
MFEHKSDFFDRISRGTPYLIFFAFQLNERMFCTKGSETKGKNRRVQGNKVQNNKERKS